jgi:branched-chain amino acid transport system permease protein
MSLLASIFVAGVLAASWNLMAGFCGYVSFGHQVFFGIGAYTAAILVTGLNLGEGSLLYSILLGGLVSSGVAFAFGYVALILRGPYFSILTLGFSELMYVIMVNTPWFGGAEGLNLPPVYILPKYYVITLIIFVVCFIFLYRMRRSKFGLALASIRQDEDAAESSGIPTHLYKMLAFTIAAFFPGLIGAAYVWYITYIDAVGAFQLHMVVEMIAITMFGGLGTVVGPLIGAFVFVLLSELLWSSMPELYLVVLGVIIVFIIQVMPRGVVIHILERLKIKFI